MFLHQCIIKKPVMDPWPAPIKIVKITDVLSMTRKDLELPSNISKLYSFNTVLHQWTFQGRQPTNKSEVLLPLPSKVASFLRCRISPFNDALTPVDRQ